MVCLDSGHVIKLSITPDVLGIVVDAGSGIMIKPKVIGIAELVLIALQVTLADVATYFSY